MKKFFLFLVIAVLAAIYFTYVVVMGFNFFLFTDELLKVPAFPSPSISWTFMGILIGIVVGTMVAIKKLRLAKKVLLYPVLILFVFVSVMFMINKPSAKEVSNGTMMEMIKSNRSPSYIVHKFYLFSVEGNLRIAPRYKSKIIQKGYKGAEVEVIDQSNIQWYKVKYNNKIGYVNYRELQFSRVVSEVVQ